MVGPLVFFTVAGLLLALVHFYLWARLVRGTTRPGRWRRVGTWSLVAVAVLAGATFVLTRTVGVDAGWLAWPGYVWIALMFYLLVALVVLEVPRAVLALRRRLRPAPATDAETGTQTERRLFISRSLAVTAGVVAVGAVGVGARTAMADVRAVPVRVPVRRLDPSLAGFRIALVSDLHLGPFMREDFAQQVVETVNREQPDLIAVVGDLADGTAAELRRAVAPLRGLMAEHGAYFVTGNHEYSSGADGWIAEVRALGLRPLLNERVEIISGAASFDLAGVTDLSARMYGGAAPDYAAAASGRSPERPLLLLAHQPVQVFEAMKHGVDLQLSGHTHGGQSIPFDRLTRVQQPVVAGLAAFGQTRVFVTRGAGFFGPPVRVGVPPEVSIIELVSER